MTIRAVVADFVSLETTDHLEQDKRVQRRNAGVSKPPYRTCGKAVAVEANERSERALCTVGEFNGVGNLETWTPLVA